MRQQCGDQAAPRWVLHDETTARRVYLDDAEFLIVGESDDHEYLVYRIEPAATGLVFLERYDATPEPVRGSVHLLLQGRD